MESVQYETNVDIFKAPRNTKRVVAASAVAVAADQLQAATAATRHVREGVDESACEGCGGAKCKLQQISMFMAHVVRNFHTFDFLKDAQRVPPTQPYPTLLYPSLTPISMLRSSARVVSFKWHRWQPQSLAGTRNTVAVFVPQQQLKNALGIAFIGFLQIFNGFQVVALLLSCHFITLSLALSLSLCVFAPKGLAESATKCDSCCHV